tara:strand:+ start:898 stop:1083 length:186 start_codon:yes stop_codon:yes gene_type:complete
MVVGSFMNLINYDFRQDFEFKWLNLTNENCQSRTNAKALSEKVHSDPNTINRFLVEPQEGL